MAIFTLKNDYLDKAAEIYLAAAAEVADCGDELARLKNAKAAVNGDRTLSPDGRNLKSAELAHEIFLTNEKIEAIRANANGKVREIRRKAEKDFYDYYNATPDDIDEKLLAFVNSGAATEQELLRLAEKKSTNRTMKRVIGAKLAQSKDDRTAFYGRMYQQASLMPHLEAFDNLMGCGYYAMGGGYSGPAGAREFIRRWGEVTQATYDSAPNVGYKIDSSGDRLYFEGECPYTD